MVIGPRVVTGLPRRDVTRASGGGVPAGCAGTRSAEAEAAGQGGAQAAGRTLDDGRAVGAGQVELALLGAEGQSRGMRGCTAWGSSSGRGFCTAASSLYRYSTSLALPVKSLAMSSLTAPATLPATYQ